MLNTRSSSKTPSVDDVIRPRRGVKFESTKSFNRSTEYSNSPLDLDHLSKYCSFSSDYDIFPPSSLDRMWTPSAPGRHVIPDIYFEYGFRLPMHPFYLFVFEAFG